MNILVLNSGSATLKYQLIETSAGQAARGQDRMLARGLIERIGEAVEDHGEAVRTALTRLGDQHPIGAIEAVGHRVVHGGEYFSAPVAIDDEVVARIEECAALAPLHNPPNLLGYRAARALLPEAVHVAVFDTAFHAAMPPRAFTFGLPYELCARDKLRRYGFHGTSHRYVSERFANLRAGKPSDFKLITCHLGNGCSMCAVDRGRSVDTSMGLTPLEGLLMGTRPGDTDPAAILHIMASERLDTRAMDALLNHRSGLLGVSGISNDMRALLAQAAKDSARARLAIDVFCYRVRKYIGAYYAVLNGADAVIFTAGIGEHAPEIRARSCDGLDALGIRIDPERNQAVIGAEAEISARDAATQVWVIPTNEELLIARDTLAVASALR